MKLYTIYYVLYIIYVQSIKYILYINEFSYKLWDKGDFYVTNVKAIDFYPEDC